MYFFYLLLFAVYSVAGTCTATGCRVGTSNAPDALFLCPANIPNHKPDHCRNRKQDPDIDHIHNISFLPRTGCFLSARTHSTTAIATIAPTPAKPPKAAGT